MYIMSFVSYFKYVHIHVRIGKINLPRRRAVQSYEDLLRHVSRCLATIHAMYGIQ